MQLLLYCCLSVFRLSIVEDSFDVPTLWYHDTDTVLPMQHHDHPHQWQNTPNTDD